MPQDRGTSPAAKSQVKFGGYAKSGFFSNDGLEIINIWLERNGQGTSVPLYPGSVIQFHPWDRKDRDSVWIQLQGATSVYSWVIDLYTDVELGR